MNVSLYPAEFVFPGHPDKLCDAIADALVQAANTLEKRALVGVEVACHRNKVFITGRIGCRDANTIDVEVWFATSTDQQVMAPTGIQAQNNLKYMQNCVWVRLRMVRTNSENSRMTKPFVLDTPTT